MIASFVTLTGLTGPDGSGKTTAVASVRDRLAGEGLIVSSTYTYGCVLCRQMPGRPVVSPAAQLTTVAAEQGERPLVARKSVSAVARLHALLDAGELAMKLLANALVVKVRALRRPRAPGAPPCQAVIITDRTPLDALVKFDLAPEALPSRVLLAIARRYDTIVVLDAPGEVLAARDGEHRAEELDAVRSRLEPWCRLLPNSVRVDVTTERADDAVVHALKSEFKGTSARCAGQGARLEP